jgi:hypothetical protein
MRRQHRFQKFMMAAVALLVSGGCLIAQELPPPPHAMAVAPGMFGAEVQFSHKLVTGAPFSAQAVTEINQTLSDGNQIHRTLTASLYRDSQGRTRREGGLGEMGLWAIGQGKAPQMVLITDPVAGVNYVLNSTAHTAMKMPLPPMHDKPPFSEKTPLGPEGDDNASPQTESLGSQMIAGVQAEGTRVTRTIPAGTIGNQQPINIVTERWYSPALQMVVMSKRTDPMMGQTTFQLTNINQAEPPAALFQVPADFTVQDGPAPRQFGRRRRANPNP